MQNKRSNIYFSAGYRFFLRGANNILL